GRYIKIKFLAFRNIGGSRTDKGITRGHKSGDRGIRVRIFVSVGKLGIKISLYGIIPVADSVPSIGKGRTEAYRVIGLSQFLFFLGIKPVSELQKIFPVHISKLIIPDKLYIRKGGYGIVTPRVPVYKRYLVEVYPQLVLFFPKGGDPEGLVLFIQCLRLIECNHGTG